MFLLILRRLRLSLLIIFLAVTALYLMIHMVPGDPVNVLLGPRATPELRQELIQRLGLDQPIYIQLFTFYVNILKGDLGKDIQTGRSVWNLVIGQLPYTLSLVASALVVMLAMGIPMGCIAAIYRDSLFDNILAVLSVSMIAVPSFVVALYLLLIFAVMLGWFPAIGVGGGGIIDTMRYVTLPTLSIAIGWIGYVARLVRSSLLETLGENHIRTAKAYGLPPRKIILEYALRIAILPTVTVVCAGVGSMLSSAVFVEIIFARPGIGKMIFDAVTSRNYPLVMGAVLVTTTTYVLILAISDIINGYFDPRIRKVL
jgi:peptide/nickel transport system permease protein